MYACEWADVSIQYADPCYGASKIHNRLGCRPTSDERSTAVEYKLPRHSVIGA